VKELKSFRALSHGVLGDLRQRENFRLQGKDGWTELGSAQTGRYSRLSRQGST
jgi:hypothetical protein